MSPIECTGEQRRKAVRGAPLYGLDYIEVSNDGRTLDVFFLGKAPQSVNAANVRISGGRRIRGIQVTSLEVHRQEDETLDDRLEIRVNTTGDFSDYTLRLVKLDEEGRPTSDPMDGFDPIYNSVTFSFKANCPSDLDCKSTSQCPPTDRPQPEINYLAKDYNSFRQLILDRLALTMPDWRERHAPDIGIMLVEVLAYVGDYLSYYQDAVATEAYLATARRRISVCRHVRLIDYAMHEGCNARALLTIEAADDYPLVPSDVFFTTSLPGLDGTRVAQAGQLRYLPASSYEIFEPLVADSAQPIQLYRVHSEIHFYTWGNSECCLLAGVTAATLVDAWVSNGETSGRALHLRPGDLLIFEEILGPVTGNPADADPKHRQAVRLTKVTETIDPLVRPEGSDLDRPLVEIEWCAEDALTFPLCISARMPAPDCGIHENITVARGNILLVDHGARIEDEPLATVPPGQTLEHCACRCTPASTTTVPERVCPTLRSRPLTFAEPLPGCACAATLLLQDPRRALPQVWLTGVEPTPAGDMTTSWRAVRDLLDSSGTSPDFVIEMDDDGVAHLRFGDGTFGAMPAAATTLTADYRTGNGPAGNIGAESIGTLVFRQPANDPGLRPRNPLSAVGGTSAQSVDEVKMFAPGAFRNRLGRAIVAEDYATLASDNARRFLERAGPEACAAFQKLQSAKARLRWTGGWYQVSVAIDPLAAEHVDPRLLSEMNAFLEPYRRVGHDLLVQQAQLVGLDVALRVCVADGYLRGHVKGALLDLFSNRILRDGARGFFHPDNLTFGEGIYASRIVAAAQNVAGVKEVTLLRLLRYEIGTPPGGSDPVPGETPADGVLPLGAFEIARLDNDRNFPENGRLILDLRGGR